MDTNNLASLRFLRCLEQYQRAEISLSRLAELLGVNIAEVQFLKSLQAGGTDP